MSPLPARMLQQKDLVNSSVAEFLGCWAVGGKATLTLNTVNSVTTVAFTTTLPGHPEAPLHPAPLPAGPPQQPLPGPRRHRGPAQRDRDRLRAARHQAAKTVVTAPVVSSSPKSVTALVASSPPPSSPPEASTGDDASVSVAEELTLQFKCDQCNYSNSTEKGLRQHIRMKHKIAQLDGFEDSIIEISKKPEVKESKSQTDNVSLNDVEVQTDPGDVFVKVKEVSKNYHISVKESLKDRISEELDSFWEESKINEFSVKQELNFCNKVHPRNTVCFNVEISCREFSESFTASSAASLLKSLPWPDGFNVMSSEPTRYKEMNQ